MPPLPPGRLLLLVLVLAQRGRTAPWVMRRTWKNACGWGKGRWLVLVTEYLKARWKIWRGRGWRFVAVSE
jgi:hypothetical protein